MEHILVGQEVKGLYVCEGEYLLAFQVDSGYIVLEVSGECCSESWFADITGVDQILGGTVTDVEYVEAEDVLDDRTRQSYDLCYGIKLKTTRGYADIVFRNSSNGYYGGSVDRGCLLPALPDGIAWSEITDEWSA